MPGFNITKNTGVSINPFRMTSSQQTLSYSPPEHVSALEVPFDDSARFKGHYQSLCQQIMQLQDQIVQLKRTDPELTPLLQNLERRINSLVHICEASQRSVHTHGVNKLREMDHPSKKHEREAMRTQMDCCTLPVTPGELGSFYDELSRAYKHQASLQSLFIFQAIDSDASLTLGYLEQSVDSSINYNQVVPDTYYWARRGENDAEGRPVPTATYLGHAVDRLSSEVVKSIVRRHWQGPGRGERVASVLDVHYVDLNDQQHTPLSLVLIKLQEHISDEPDSFQHTRMQRVVSMFNTLVKPHLDSAEPVVSHETAMALVGMMNGMQCYGPYCNLKLPKSYEHLAQSTMDPSYTSIHPSKPDTVVLHYADGRDIELPAKKLIEDDSGSGNGSGAMDVDKRVSLASSLSQSLDSSSSQQKQMRSRTAAKASGQNHDHTHYAEMRKQRRKQARMAHC